MRDIPKLHPYMVFSRILGSIEGAYLVFAHTGQEAKVLGWDGELTDEYLDMGVRRLWNEDYIYREADQEKLNKNIPHVIDNPTPCKGCDQWGGDHNNEGWCQSCWEEQSDVEWEPAKGLA